MNVPTGNTDALNVSTGNTNTFNVPTTDENDKKRGANKPMSPATGSLSVFIRTFKTAVTT